MCGLTHVCTCAHTSLFLAHITDQWECQGVGPHFPFGAFKRGKEEEASRWERDTCFSPWPRHDPHHFCFAAMRYSHCPSWKMAPQKYFSTSEEGCSTFEWAPLPCSRSTGHGMGTQNALFWNLIVEWRVRRWALHSASLNLTLAEALSLFDLGR